MTTRLLHDPHDFPQRRGPRQHLAIGPCSDQEGVYRGAQDRPHPCKVIKQDQLGTRDHIPHPNCVVCRPRHQQVGLPQHKIQCQHCIGVPTQPSATPPPLLLLLSWYRLPARAQPKSHAHAQARKTRTTQNISHHNCKERNPVQGHDPPGKKHKNKKEHGAHVTTGRKRYRTAPPHKNDTIHPCSCAQRARVRTFSHGAQGHSSTQENQVHRKMGVHVGTPPVSGSTQPPRVMIKCSKMTKQP